MIHVNWEKISLIFSNYAIINQKKHRMNKELYMGIMSGTSMDGVDVVLCEIDKTSCTLINSKEYPFPPTLKEEIISVINDTTTLQKIGQLHQRLGRLFSDAAKNLLETYNITPLSVSAIGLHGQTLWHEPNDMYPFSLQLGDANILTSQTRIPVVTDFRNKDISLGGQGAPLAPAFHRFLFGKHSQNISIVNIGGMANLTVLGKKYVGYDTGCGNVLMDMWIAKHKGLKYDKDGSWARSGKVNYALLQKMLDEPYFHQAYPKSTGREMFNEAWLNRIIDIQFSPEDIQRTLLELTAITISNEVLKFNNDILMLCGGGAQNSFLIERLAILMPNIQIGIAQNGDMLEAMMMAWLAYKRIHNEHVELQNITGANQNGILGAIYQ